MVSSPGRVDVPSNHQRNHSILLCQGPGSSVMSASFLRFTERWRQELGRVCPKCGSSRSFRGSHRIIWLYQWIGLREHLDRKPWFLPSNIGLSCKFPHHPIFYDCMLMDVQRNFMDVQKMFKGFSWLGLSGIFKWFSWIVMGCRSAQF